MPRPPRILHCTSEPLAFFGRADELARLDAALAGQGPSVLALVGPGGQGKTAIVQHWLTRPRPAVDGLFFWSFYRDKDSERCLREWLAYAEGLDAPPDVSAAWCVDHLIPILRRERWAVVLDGAEVVQHEEGPWRGRFLHPDLGRLLEELGSEPTPGVVALTTRFELPTLTHRPFVRLLSLDRLDIVSARHLLSRLGVQGDDVALTRIAEAAGRHAKAVELLGTYLVDHHQGQAEALQDASPTSDEEASVAWVLGLFQQALSAEEQDVIALATTFREPPVEPLLVSYLTSPAVRTLLHETWGRAYSPFIDRESGFIPTLLDRLVRLRLLERVALGGGRVIDAHPLVRRGFEHVAGPTGRRQSALARAGFLRGLPDRRRPATLEEARGPVELFHAHCDAGLWSEADGAYRTLDNPKHRLGAPGLERELLLRFFHGRDWRQPPLWSGFGRWRSLAICQEMLGEFEEALEVYRPADSALRGDALLALGRLGPLLDVAQVPAPWQELWQAYRCHALCLAGRVDEAVRLARSLFPRDVYEWVHVFECLLRAGQVGKVEARALETTGEGWASLSWRRMRADRWRLTESLRKKEEGRRDPVPLSHEGRGGQERQADLEAEYAELIEACDRSGLAWERALTRLSRSALRRAGGEDGTADARVALELAQRHGMAIVEADAREALGEDVTALRERIGYHGPGRR